MDTPASTVSRFSASGSNTSLRRRSLISRVNQARDEERNDDEAERSSLVASERAIATSTPSSPRRARESFTSTPQIEHFQGCLKLFTENKITKDNAWHLQLIDYMTSMVRRHDSRMENLQTASTVVDASTRIYSIRVDAVHYDVLKMAGGLSKASQTKRGKKDDENGDQDDGAADSESAAVVKKKKKRSKGAIATNLDVLNGEFDFNECIDPFFEKLAATTGDVTSTNRAFSATLPIDNKNLALILRTDQRFLEEVEEDLCEELILNEYLTMPSKLWLPFNEEDHICEPFTGFSITNWDPDTEDTGANRMNNWVEENRLNLSQQAVAFDVNAEVEPIPQDDDHNDLFEEEGLGGACSEEETEAALAACVARTAGGPPRLADMRPSAPGDARLEYSYSAAIVSAWAGPAHWRLKNNRASKMVDRAQSASGRSAVEGKKISRLKREVDFLEGGMAWDWRSETGADYECAPAHKITISRKTLATGHTWNEANYKTPIDRGLDESHFRKLYLRRNVMLVSKREAARSQRTEPRLEPTQEPEPLAVEPARDYDYANENDASYCPNNIPDGDDWGNEDATCAGDVHNQTKMNELEEIGDMIEPPTKVAKIFIPYAMRAKKVDMKQLKQCTWQMLTERAPQGEKESITPTSFFSLYSRLPNKLSPNMRESLSIPLALLSVLHLANEKGLMLKNRANLKDFDVVGIVDSNFDPMKALQF